MKTFCFKYLSVTKCLFNMKKLLLPLFAIVLLIGCNSENSLTDQDQISFGIKDSLYSEVLAEQREVWVYVPEQAQERKFPVLYLLDGRGHFYSVAGMIRQLSTINGNTVVPEMVIVAITNTNRFRDLTPSHVGDSTNVSGGGDAFTQFIRDELMPYVEEKYPIADHRTMMGHSLGGLMAINTLMNYPEMFDNYMAIDPSLWWDDKKLLKEVKEVLNQRKFDDKSLFVGVANTMPKGMDITKVASDTARNTNHIRAILDFSRTASGNPQNGLNFSWKYYDDEDHGSVPLISEFDGLKFMFSWHRFPKWSEIMDTEKTVDDLLELIVSHYQKVSSKFGYEILPEQQRINFVGLTLMNREANEKAFALFDLNIENYPESPDAHESMGDYYLAQGDTTNAVSFFEQSVKLGGESAIQKLDDIGGN